MANIGTEARSTLLKGLIFVAPLLAGFVAMECGLRRVSTRASRGRAQIEAQQGRCQVLILGSSNAEFGIAAESLAEPAVNIADHTQSLYYDLALAERYVPGMPQLKVVVLALTYATIESETYDWGSWVTWPNYANHWDIPPQQPAFFEAQRWSLTALYGLRMSISYARKGFPVNLPTPPPQPLTAEAMAAEGASYAKAHTNAIHPERARDNLARLDRIAALVEQRGARLILVDTPTHDSYLQRLSHSVQARNAHNLQAFLQRHPNVMYRDYLHDPRFALDDFRDPVHLSPKGAETFTKILDTELVRPMLARP